MNRIVNHIVGIAGVILLSVTMSAQDTANVVFYRNRAEKGLARRTTINVDGKRVCSLKNGSFLEIALPPGEHEFSGPNKAQGGKVTLQPGKTYYFATRHNHERPFQFQNVWAIYPVSPEQGSFEVTSLKPLDRDDTAPEYQNAAHSH
jgi:Protein of unknown function (DUF2846)